MLNEKQINHFKRSLQKLLIFGRAPYWLYLKDSNGDGLLLAELIQASDVVAANNKNNWDISKVLGREPENLLMVIVDMSNTELIAVFERGMDIPNPVFEGVEAFYNTAQGINYDGSRPIFPDWKVTIKFALIAFCILFTLILFQDVF